MIEDGATLIASHSGLRGRLGAGLTPPVVAATMASFADLLGRPGQPATVGVARDERPSGLELLPLVTAALTSRGVDVVDLGVVSTPTAKLAARQTGLAGLAMVTGSHLGPEWNGIKLMAGPGLKPLDVGALPPPSDDAYTGPAGAVSSDETAAARHAAVLCAEAEADAEAIRSARLRVRLRGGAGSAGTLALRDLGCSLTEAGAGVSLALDADGDRLELGDEDGRPLDPEATLCLAALGANARTVVKGADTSCMIDLVMARLGGRVHVTEPGELHLIEGVEAFGADIAGEGNGGVVVPRVGMARDGLAAAVVILGLMARTGAALSELCSRLPELSRRRFTVPCLDASAARSVLRSVAAETGHPFEDARRGVRVLRPGSTWALVRHSATEPVLRVTVESPDPARADLLETELRAHLA